MRRSILIVKLMCVCVCVCIFISISILTYVHLQTVANLQIKSLIRHLIFVPFIVRGCLCSSDAVCMCMCDICVCEYNLKLYAFFSFWFNCQFLYFSLSLTHSLCIRYTRWLVIFIQMHIVRIFSIARHRFGKKTTNHDKLKQQQRQQQKLNIK